MYEPEETTAEKVVTFFKALVMALYVVAYLVEGWFIVHTNLMHAILIHFPNPWAGASMAVLVVLGPVVLGVLLFWKMFLRP